MHLITSLTTDVRLEVSKFHIHKFQSEAQQVRVGETTKRLADVSLEIYRL